MRKRLSLLMAMAIVVILVFALNPGVASANPGNGGDGIDIATADDHAGKDAPAYSNEPTDEDPNGGMWGNPADADSKEGCVDCGTGADAMQQQIDHNPTCSAHEDH